MVHNYSRRAIAIIALVALLLVTVTAVAVGAEGEEIEVTIGTSRTDCIGLGGPEECPCVWYRLGQRLTIPNRLVTEIGYRVWKVGSPTGDIILSIRDFATSTIIVSVVWGDASELPDPSAGGIRKVRLDEPVRVNGEVILCVEYYGGNTGNTTDYCVAGYRTGNYRDGETYMNYYHYGSWHDIGEAEEGGYFYAYIDEGVVDPPQNGADGGDTGEGDTNGTDWMILWSVAGVLVAGGGFIIYRNQKGRKKTPE